MIFARSAAADVRLTRDIVKVDPVSVAGADDSLCAQDGAVFFFILKPAQLLAKLCLAELLRRLHAPAAEHFVGVMVVMMVMVLMLVIVVIVVVMVVALALRIVALLAVLMVMMVMVLMFVIVIVVVMMVALALRIVALLAVLMVVMMVMMLMLVLQLFHLGPQSVLLHCRENLCAVQLRPGGRDQARLRVHALEKLCRLKDLLLACGVGSAHDDEVGAGHLVIEELAEVARIHFCLAGIHNRNLRADLRILDAFHCRRNIRELPHAGGLNQDAVRGIVRDNLLQRLGEVPDQRAADAAGVHLRDLDPRILQESAVDGDVAEFILDQDKLFALVCFLNQFANQCGFSGTEKSGKNVDCCHSVLASINLDAPRGASLF